MAMIPVGLTKREYKKMVAELARLFYDYYCQHRQNLVLKSSESTEEQGARANPEGTIKNQEQRLRQEIIARNRTSSFGELVAVFIDDGVSAKDTKRPALQRLLRAVEAGEVTMVMATEYSRISRNMRDFASMWELFKSFKCGMISLRENFDTSTAAGEMMLA